MSNTFHRIYILRGPDDGPGLRLADQMRSYGYTIELVPRVDKHCKSYVSYCQQYIKRITNRSQDKRTRMGSLMPLPKGTMSSDASNMEKVPYSSDLLIENYRYRTILSKAEQRKEERIIICQDSCSAIGTFQEDINKVMRNLPLQWKILKLGSNKEDWKHIDIQKASKRGLYPIRAPSYGTFAIGLHYSVYHEFSKHLANMLVPVDKGAMVHMCQSNIGKCFVCYPNLIVDGNQTGGKPYAVTTIDLNEHRPTESQTIRPSEARLTIKGSEFKSDFFKRERYDADLTGLNENKTKIYLSHITFGAGEDQQGLNNCKGINIDNTIIETALRKLNFSNIDYLRLDWTKMEHYAAKKVFGNVSLDGEYYIFSEILLYGLFVHLLNNKKKVIIVPNPDSYCTFTSLEPDWFKLMRRLNSYSGFHIWSKTKQIHEWLSQKSLTSNTYINFNFMSQASMRGSPKSRDRVLLDTGSSTCNRKYITEIADIFANNPSLPFKLVIKTVPTVYRHRSYRLSRYEKAQNIQIISSLMSKEDLETLYSKFQYIIYLAKFDGYGLTLSKAINNNMFIFAGDGLPWSELLNHYPRKCYINVQQDFSRSMGGTTKGFARSQTYYKCDFNDLRNKLRNIDHFNKIIDKTEDECSFYSWLNTNIFLGNLYKFFTRDHYYNNSSIYMCSYLDRSIILLDNLVSLIFQSAHINIYLNSTCDYSLWFLNKMNNVCITPFRDDMKAVSKLYCYCKANDDSKYNLIVDDDIMYPSDYVSYTARVLDDGVNFDDMPNEKFIFSYNGFNECYKFSFSKKHTEALTPLCSIGTGTAFFRSDVIDKNTLLDYINHQMKGEHALIMADGLVSKFLNDASIKMFYKNPKTFKWLENNNKITLNKTPGLFEFKKKNNLIRRQYLSCKISKAITYKKLVYFFDDVCSRRNKREVENKTSHLHSLLHTKVICRDKNKRLTDIKKDLDYDFLITDNRNYLEKDRFKGLYDIKAGKWIANNFNTKELLLAI